MNQRNSAHTFCMALAIFLSLAFSAASHAQVTTATIFGTVLDPSGAPVPLAQITATNELTGTVKTGIANDRGEVTITFLPVGVYTFSIEAAVLKSIGNPG